MIGGDRDEQLREGFLPVGCAECGTTVQVRKTSPAQTSIQWPPGAPAGCPHLRHADAAVPAVGEPPDCPALRGSIDTAVERGQIPSALH